MTEKNNEKISGSNLVMALKQKGWVTINISSNFQTMLNAEEPLRPPLLIPYREPNILRAKYAEHLKS